MGLQYAIIKKQSQFFRPGWMFLLLLLLFYYFIVFIYRGCATSYSSQSISWPLKIIQHTKAKQLFKIIIICSLFIFIISLLLLVIVVVIFYIFLYLFIYFISLAFILYWSCVRYLLNSLHQSKLIPADNHNILVQYGLWW